MSPLELYIRKIYVLKNINILTCILKKYIDILKIYIFFKVNALSRPKLRTMQTCKPLTPNTEKVKW